MKNRVETISDLCHLTVRKREDRRVIELTQNSILVDGPEMGSQIEYHISNGQALRRATELELDVVEPSIICHNTTSTEKVVILDKNVSKEEKLSVLRKVIKEYGNRKN